MIRWAYFPSTETASPHNREGPPRAIPDRKTTAPGSQRAGPGVRRLVMGALYSTLAPSTKSAADTGTSQQVAQGKALFAVSCASCHGLNGEGQVSGNIQGPPLNGVGAAAVEFQVATGRMPMAHPGPQAQTKPSQFTEDE